MTSRHTFLFSTALLGLVSLGLTQYLEDLPSHNLCIPQTTCRKCIEVPKCAWCYDPAFNMTPRCFLPNSPPLLPGQVCPEEYTVFPVNYVGRIIHERLSHAVGKSQAAASSGTYAVYEAQYNESRSYFEKKSKSSFGSAAGSASGGRRLVQIAPQYVQLHLRARESHTINMFYTQAEDYPVDLYYLMDLSRSMYDDKEKLSLLGDLLAETMRRMTSNFMLGFGSFVDKVVMPYVSTLEDKLQHPCEDCQHPYGYINHLKLSTNTSKFSTLVKQAPISGNLDAPEGGFDAIMQAIVCRDHIGWREQARRLLVFSTDSSFHYAGDGKLGGIVKPNDGNCYLRNREYYMSTKQDYPSISQINQKVKEHSINIIFAVTGNVIETYRQLETYIEGSSCAQLSEDSSNIVELVKQQYEQISSTIEMKHNASEYVNIRFFSECLNTTGKAVETTTCKGLKVGDIIKFKLEVEVLKCPEDPSKWNEKIEVSQVGLAEKLIIDLEMLCGCEKCEKNVDYTVKSPECNSHGVLVCGVCHCDKDAQGTNCECHDLVSQQNLTANCIDPNGPLNMECSGNGICNCGLCICFKPTIVGRYCECDANACDRRNGLICSGHGECDCYAKCKCHPGWSGPDCGCSEDTSTCINPYSNKLCSDHGECKCGQCYCSMLTNETRYFGQHCEKCSTCGDRCEELKNCVQCQMYQTGELTEEECSTNCTLFTPIAVKDVKANSELNEQLCAYYDEADDCRFAYVYYYEDKILHVKAQEKKECPPKVFLLGIVLGVIAAIVLVGLAILLMWKLLTTIHDRREFAKFEKERMMAKWESGENPIYKQATSTFKNPTYAGKG